MVVNWGPARSTTGTNAMRVGLELRATGSGTTRTVHWEIWLWTRRASYGSSASYSVDSGVSSGSFSYNHSNNSRDWPTQNRTRVARGSFTRTLQYGSTQRVNIVGRIWGVSTTSGTASHSRAITLPARPYGRPAAPSGATVSRSSDSAQVIRWTNRGTAAAPVTRTRVRRRNYDGNPRGTFTAFTDRGTSTGASFTDSTVSNWWYEYAIRAEGPGGNSAWVNLPGINTTPSAPPSLSVTPRGDGNFLSWRPGHRWIEGIRVEIQRQENGGAWTDLVEGGPESTGYLHANPNLAVTHRYRIRARSSRPVLYSGWRNSGVVQLSAPPAAPSGLGPRTPWDATERRTLTWTHVPTDGSEQTAYQIRRRRQGGSWTTVARTVSRQSAYSLMSWTYSNGDVIEWQVRTWGIHPDPGPWSITNVQRPQAHPSVAINSPLEGETIDTSMVMLTWGYAQQQDSGQAEWQWELVTTEPGQGWDDPQYLTTVRAGSGTGSTAAHAIAGLENNTEYQLWVRARSVYGLWSDWDVVTFSVIYVAPQAPGIAAAWDAAPGAAAIEIHQPTWDEDFAEPDHHQVWRSADRGTVAAWNAIQEAVKAREERDLTEPRVNIVTNPRGRRLSSGGLPSGWTGAGIEYAPEDDGVSVPAGVEVTVSVDLPPEGLAFPGESIFPGGSTFPRGSSFEAGTLVVVDVVTGEIYRQTGATVATVPAVSVDRVLRVALVRGVYFGAYFDGHTSDTDDTSYEWWDEPDNSPSVETDLAVPRAQAAFAAAWASTRVLIADLVPLDTAITDPIPAIGDGTGNVYQAVTVSALPSEAMGDFAFLEVRASTRGICPEPENRSTTDAFYLNGGSDMTQAARALYEPSVSESLSKPETVRHRFSGRKRPVAFYGDGEEVTLAASFVTLPNEVHHGSTAATFDQWRELVSERGPHLFRDWLGRRFFVDIDGFDGTRSEGDIMAVSLAMVRLEDVEPDPEYGS